MRKEIDGFVGKYEFLSNSYPIPVKYDFETYPSVEHAYQASKFLNLNARQLIRECKDAAEAKKLSKDFSEKIGVRGDWKDFQLKVMYNLLLQKFSDKELRKKLLDTRGYYLKNSVASDLLWGVFKDKGFNVLGIMLMRIRDTKLL